jgi:nucleoside-diphosphate-sugar epimerase
MKVLILGGTGELGPHVAEAIGPHHQVLVTDINPPTAKASYKFVRVDITSLEQVMQAAKDMDAIINLSAVRQHRQIAFDVNVRGCYHMMLAAVQHGIRRVINTGPTQAVTGPSYTEFDSEISPDAPSRSGTLLYWETKSLGQEICRVFSENYDIYVQEYLFNNMRDPAKPRPGDTFPFVVAWADAGEVFRSGLEVDLSTLPSRCEVFHILADIPHGRFLSCKTKLLLGFKPKENLSHIWHRAV